MGAGHVLLCGMNRSHEGGPESFAKVKEEFDRFREKAPRPVADFLRKADEFITEDPWKAVGVAAVAGFVIGMMWKSRR